MLLPRVVRRTEEMTPALNAQLIFLLGSSSAPMSPHGGVSPHLVPLYRMPSWCVSYTGLPWHLLLSSSLLVTEYLSTSTWLSHLHRFSQIWWLPGNLQTQLIGTNSLVMWKFHLNVLRYKNKGQDAWNTCFVHNSTNLRFKNKLNQGRRELEAMCTLMCILIHTYLI